jgi:sporulation protein YlmC with PRC-barrel domain
MDLFPARFSARMERSMAMDTKIQFQKNATVLAADGQQVGTLSRVVVNPDTRALTAIVVRKSALFNPDEKVVPIELVAETTEDQILMHDEAGDLESFPPFEEKLLVDANEYADELPPSGKQPSSIFGSNDLGMTVTRPAPGTQLVTQIKQNIPEGTVAMKEGAKVLTIEGKHVGNVEQVLADPLVDQITHLLISRGMFMKETKLIPINWVMMMGGEKVHLRVKKASVEELNEYPIAG